MFTLTDGTYFTMAKAIAEMESVLDAVYEDVIVGESDDPCLWFVDINFLDFDNRKTIPVNLSAPAKAQCGVSEMLDHIAHIFAMRKETIVSDALLSCASALMGPQPVAAGK